MHRAALVLFGLALCCGCNTTGRPSVDPFGRPTRVPAPGTGAAANPGDPYYRNYAAPVAPGALPVAPGAATPSGIPPVGGGAIYTPPSAITSPGVQPPMNGYPAAAGAPVTSYAPGSTSNLAPTNSPLTTMPVSQPTQIAPGQTYQTPTSPYQSIPGQTTPPSVSPAPTAPASAAPGYLPSGGMNYQGTYSPAAPTGSVANSYPNVAQAGISAPATPSTAVSYNDGLGSAPSVVRIPDSAQMPIAEMPNNSTTSSPTPVNTASTAAPVTTVSLGDLSNGGR